MKILWDRIIKFIDLHPIFSTLVVFCLLLDLVIVGNIIRRPITKTTSEEKSNKVISVYSASSSAYINSNAEVDKSGSVTIIAQTGGIVGSIFVNEGQKIGFGQRLMSINTDANGNNVSALLRQINEISNGTDGNNNSIQKTILDLQRRISEKISSDIGASGGSVADMQRELAVRNTDIGLNGVNQASEISKINLQIASINASLSSPSTPISGNLDQILVRRGQAVAPGTPLAIVSNNSGKATIRVRVTDLIAKNLDLSKSASSTVGDGVVGLKINNVSSAPINGSLFLINLNAPQGLVKLLTDSQQITVSLPIKYNGSLLIPLDTVHVSDLESYVYVNDSGIAKKTNIKISEIMGGLAIVNQGLSTGDKVILNRNVVDGEHVRNIISQ